MRIALISEHASPLATLGGVDAGGQNTHVAELAAALAAGGHDIRVYTRRDSPDLPEVVPLGDRVDVVHVPAGPPAELPKDDLLPFMGAFARWMTDDWNEWRPAVAHAHFWMSGIAAVTAGRACDVPVVQTYHALGSVKRRHQGASDTSPPCRVSYERGLGRAADRVIAQCRDELDELAQLGIPPGRIALVPSGVNTDRFCPAERGNHGPAARPRILAVARLVERKGIEDLIRALPDVPQTDLVVAGGPPIAELDTDPYARRLAALSREAGVSERVHLLGAVPAHLMPEIYRSADVLAATPWYEPFGLAPLEAMACGVPVVANAVGGLTDTVVDGVTGELVPPRDPVVLAATLRRVLGDEHRRRAYAVAGTERAVRSYAWPRIAERLTDVYRSVAEARPREVLA
jgi:glycosyltransferase involved in cell wall biosynthesis